MLTDPLIAALRSGTATLVQMRAAADRERNELTAGVRARREVEINRRSTMESEPTDPLIKIRAMQRHAGERDKHGYSSVLAEAAREIERLRAPWRSIESAPVGQIVLLYNRIWRHPFPGQKTGAYGSCYVDTCEPEAKGWQANATHWMPLPNAPRQ